MESINKPSHCYGAGTPIVRITDFYNGRLADFGALQRVTLTDSEREKYALNEGDILVNRVNSIGFLGKSALVTALVEPTVFESNMMRIHFDPARLRPEFVVELIQTPQVLDVLRKRAKQAVNQASINQGDVQSLRLIVPPLERQERFVRAVTEARSLSVDSALSKVSELRSSLLARAFTGELTAEWRKHNADALRPEAKERDEALAAAGVPAYRRSTIQEDRDMWADPTAGSYAELSDEQARLFHDLKRYFNYPSNTGLFSAEAVADQLGDVFGISTDAVRRHLDVFAARGLLIRVTRERPSAESPEFAVLYRHPHLPGDDSEDDDDRRPAELLKLAARVAPKFRRVAEQPETEATE